MQYQASLKNYVSSSGLFQNACTSSDTNLYHLGSSRKVDISQKIRELASLLRSELAHIEKQERHLFIF